MGMVNVSAGCVGCHQILPIGASCSGCRLPFCAACTTKMGRICPNCGSQLV